MVLLICVARTASRWALALAVCMPAAARAAAQQLQQDSAPHAPRPATAQPAGAPVVVGSDTLFRLYGTLGPFSPATRAQTASDRLAQLAASARAGDSISAVEQGGLSEIISGDRVLFAVVDSDAHAVGRSRELVAAQYAAAAQQAVRRLGESMSTRGILIDVLEAVLSTAVLVLVLWTLGWAARHLRRRIDALRRLRVPALRIQQLELLSAGRLAALLARGTHALRVVLIVAAFYVYVPLVLSFFPWTAPLSRRIVGYAVHPFAAAGVAFANYLPNLFYLAAGVIIARYLLVFLRLIFDALGSGSITVQGFYPDWAGPTYKIVRVLVFAFAVTALYPFLPGANSDAFKGVSIFLGVVVSFGSSGAIGNLVAGVVLTYTRAFQIGDRVQIGETVGDVTEKTLLVTRLRTIKNVAVTVPNGTVLGSQVINYSTLAGSHGLILHTSVTIGYDAPWRRVHELLVNAALRTEHLLREPAPFVLQTALDDFYVQYEINAHTDRPELMADTYSRLHENIQESFNEGGVEIMSPHYTSLRDGNEITIPRAQQPPEYRVPAFRIHTSHDGERTT
ncbi:MAG TPA: mechanosensitive ion channel family protein [Gemmatimonadaceae bacterium]|nr:mechanosensitive ion channel family protein [Gemmatimonadaceae bacterium]